MAIREAQWLVSMSEPISHFRLSIIWIMCNSVTQIKKGKKYDSAILHVHKQIRERQKREREIKGRAKGPSI